jgi:8-oxo-dGTP pyrophosphatase MutT (NUDIX family)
MSYIKELRKLIGNKRVICVAAGAILENEKEEILLQLRSDTKDYGTPGGIMELGETIIDALIREIKEETNLSLSPKNIQLFGIYSGEKCLTIYPNDDEVEYVVFIFYAKITDKQTIKKDSESLSLDFFKRDNLPKNIKESDKIWISKWVNRNFEVEVD